MTPEDRQQAAQALRRVTEGIQAQADRLAAGEPLPDIARRLQALGVELRQTQQWAESEVLTALNQGAQGVLKALDDVGRHK